MDLPALRSEARNLMARKGNLCSMSTCRMISPTAPVAPTTATLGNTNGPFPIRGNAIATLLVLPHCSSLDKTRSLAGDDVCKTNNMSETDRSWMLRALELAERGRGFVEPNPLVGALVVRDGKIIGEGWHERFGQAHAEVNALAAAGEAARGATLFVTLEPCCHYGKTPPCTDSILKAGINRVLAAMVDPFPQVAGQGEAVLRAAGIVVEIGLC